MDDDLIDACVAVKWFLPERLSDAADESLIEPEARVAPDRLRVEVGNAPVRAIRSGGITLDHAREATERLDRLVQLRPTRELVVRAVEIATAIGCTNYDALYVAAAEIWNPALVTADRRVVHQLTASRWTGQVRPLGG